MKSLLKKTINSFLFALIPLFTGCNENAILDKKNSVVIDLSESTDIVISMISSQNRQKFFSEIVEEPHLIDSLIKNVSPSEIAFESEILSFGAPVVVLFYESSIAQNMQVLELFKNFATKNPAIKCVIVDVFTLWKIAQQAKLEVLPSLSIFNNREEVFFVDDVQNWNMVEQSILDSINKNLEK